MTEGDESYTLSAPCPAFIPMRKNDNFGENEVYTLPRRIFAHGLR